MANVGYDALELTISADVSKASRGIKSLTNNLSNLQDIAKKLDFSLLDKLEKHLQDIAKIDFTNVSKGLRDVVSAFQQVNKEQSKFKSKTIDNTKAINLLTAGGTGKFNYEPPLPQIKLPQPVLPDLASSPTFSAINGLNDGMGELKVNAEQIKVAMENAKKSIKDTGKEAGNSAKSGFQKLIGAFKRVLFYRVVRRTLQLIAQAFKEGIQNVAMFDEDFNKSMSNIKSSVSYLKDSLGAVIAPLIEMLEPFITMLVDGLADVANKLGEIFSAMAGKDTYTKAIKGAEDYAESLKKVKDTTLGIDELNVIKPQEQGGNFEKAEVEKTAMNEALGEFGETLKGILSDVFGSAKEHLAVIFDVLRSVMPSILTLIEPIHKIVMSLDSILVYVMSVVGDILKQILPPIANMLGKILYFIASVIEFLKPIIQFVATTIKYVFDLLEPALTMICEFTGALFEGVGKIFEVLKPILEIVNAIYTYLGGKLINTIRNFFSGESDIETPEGYNQKYTSWLKFPNGYATGGFVEDGFFYANHNELIGQFSNGQTAVANNEQIIEGIKQGVYEAMTLAGGSDDKGGTQVVVYLDSNEIAKRVEQRTLARKDNNIVGAYKYGS